MHRTVNSVMETELWATVPLTSHHHNDHQWQYNLPHSTDKLVTYDVNTVPSLLVRLANEGFKHDGVVFVNNLTIRSDDIGGLMNAIVKLYSDEGAADWTERVYF